MTDNPQKQPTKPRKFSQLRKKAKIKSPPHYGAGSFCMVITHQAVQRPAPG